MGVRLVVLALVAFVACATTLVASSRRAVAAGRAVTVTPPSGLVDQVVSVTWSGFDPTTPEGLLTDTVLQCKGLVPTSLADCYQLVRPTGTAVPDAKTVTGGTGQAFLEVRPAATLPDLDCTATNACSVLVFENNGPPPDHGLPPESAVAPLRFAPSPSDCPRVNTPDVTTIGEESAAAALYAWSGRVCTGTNALALDYTGTNTPAGRGDFLDGSDDVGITSVPPPATELSGSKRKFTYAPLDLDAVVVAYNVTDPTTGQAITDMKLTPRLVAELIAGQQLFGPGTTLFQDPEFKALNPGHTWPIQTQPPLLRGEPNSDTYVLTSWLEQDAAARAYLQGKDPVAAVDDAWKNVPYPTDIFETRDSALQGAYNPLTGTLPNARNLFNFVAPGGSTVLTNRYTDGIFAVMDAVTAVEFGVPVAKIQPANAAPDTPFVGPDVLALAAGYTAMKANPDGITKFPDVSTRSGYPMVKVDYGMVPTAGVGSTKAAKIGRFLDYASGTGQQAGVLPPGYLPLPSDARAETVKARDAVVNQTGNPPTTTTTTTPTAIGAGAVDQGFPADAGGDLGGGTGFDSSASSDANLATPAAAADLPAALASTRKSSKGGIGNIVVGAIRDFLSGDNQMILPVAFVLGAAALLAGPVLTARSSRWPWRRKRRRGSRGAGAANTAGT